MYRSLNLKTLGATSRQSELLELALTHKFIGMDVDVETIARRQTLETLPRTRQMFESAKITLDGFHLPLAWHADADEFEAKRQEQAHLLAMAGGLGMAYAVSPITPDTARPFPEEFEQHTSRIAEVADQLGESGIRLGLTFNASASARNEEANEFVANVEKFLALLDSIKSEHVGIVVDTWNWVVGGGDADQMKALPVEKIVAARFASLPEGTAPSDAKADDRVMPDSEGVVNNGSFLAALAEMDYQGPVMVWPAVEPGKKSSDVLVRQAKKALDQLWIDGGLAPAPPPVESAGEPEEVDASK